MSAAPQRVWITGASSGLGEALAQEYARTGAAVMLTARGEQALGETARALDARGSGHVYPADVTVRTRLETIVADMERDHGALDLAILNAGTYFETGLDEFDPDRIAELMNINFQSVVECIAVLLPRFRARGRGNIVVVASVAGDIGLPYAGAYAASKSALNRLCQSLHPELAAEGITLSVVNPGFIRTPLTDRNPFPMPFLIEPEEAARATRRGIERGRFEIRYPLMMSLSMRLLRALPRRVSLALTRRMLRRPGQAG